MAHTQGSLFDNFLPKPDELPPHSTAPVTPPKFEFDPNERRESYNHGYAPYTPYAALPRSTTKIYQEGAKKARLALEEARKRIEKPTKE